ncbi:MAG TPA: type VI secretion system accessory protein TagJ [Rubrivivax sp.]|nr:type VI secretion system accessory protein TagJ [Rubrivivax sp.]
MSDPASLLAAGDLAGALHALKQQVRQRPDDAKLRIFLFQLLAVLGDWKKSLEQLEVCGQLDAGTLAMVATYRAAVQCETLRDAVFAGRTTPIVFGRPQPWVALLVQALRDDAAGEAAAAAAHRAQAFDDAPASAGTLDGQPFAWIADADSRLGPLLEVVIGGRYGWLPFEAIASLELQPPEDLRDLVWAPAHLGFAQGGDTVALVPVRYAGTAEQDDGALRMARRTEWLAIADGQFRGLGQRLLATESREVGLLECRSLRMAGLPGGPADHTPVGGGQPPAT